MKAKSNSGCKRKTTSVNRQLAGKLSWINRELKSLNPSEKVPVQTTPPTINADKTKTIPSINLKLFIISVTLTLSLFTALTLVSDPSFSLWDKFSGNGITGAEITVAPIEETEIIPEEPTPEENLSLEIPLPGSTDNITNLTNEINITSNQSELFTTNLTISGVTEVTSCQNLGIANEIYNLTTTVVSTVTCFNITANNVTLDCNNWSNEIIYGNATSSLARFGVYSKQNLTTVRNCQIREGSLAAGTTRKRYSIHLNQSYGGMIEKVNASINLYGVYFFNVFNTSINSSTADSNVDSGIYLLSSSNNNVSYLNARSNVYGITLISGNNNIIQDSNLSENTQYDFAIPTSLSNPDCNNNLTNVLGSGNRTISYYNYSVVITNGTFSEFILCNADYSNISNITISGSDSLNNSYLLLRNTEFSNLSNINSSNNYYGFFLSNSSNNSLSSCTANYNSVNGIEIGGLSLFNNISSCTANSNAWGISIGTGSRYNIITSSTTNYNQIGIITNADNTTIISSTANNNSDTGIYIGSNENNRIFNSTTNFNSQYGIDIHGYYLTITSSTANSNSLYGVYGAQGNTNTITSSITNSNSDSGIRLDDMEHIIVNTTANFNKYGISILGNSNNLTYITANSNTIGLYVSSANNNILNSSILDNNSYGVYLEVSNNNLIQNINLSESLVSDVWVYADDDTECTHNFTNVLGSGNRTISYYNYSVVVTNGTFSEFILCNADYSNISNITVIGSDSLNNNGVYLYRTEISNISNISSNGNLYGFYIEDSSDNILSNNYAFNNTIGYYLAYLASGSKNNTLINGQAGSNSKAVFINSSSAGIYNNVFRDYTFTGNTLDLEFTNAANNLTFINSSINKSRLFVTGGALASFKWYVDVNVTDSSRNPLNNANVSAYTSQNVLDNTSTTNVNGIARLAVTEFYRDYDINYYITPSTIRATKMNYTENSTSINLYNQTYAQANLTLTEIACGSTIYSSARIGNDINCTGNAFTIGADNITIDGNNYLVTGSGTGIGFSFSNRKNITINRIKLTNFTTGIYLYNTANSTFDNVNISNSTQGIIFNDSSGNTLSDSFLSNNYAHTLLADSSSGTNNYLVNITSININNVTTTNNANLFLQWYVDVNANYTDNTGTKGILPNSNASGYFNNTGLFDYSVLTGSNGIGKLTLTELKKNSSGITYLTPHNITLSYVLQNSTAVNFTSINLSRTNNTNVNLSLTLDCTSPKDNLSVTTSITLCPGTFTADKITINANNVRLTCDGTILRSGTDNYVNSKGIESTSRSNIAIIGCNFKNYYIPIHFKTSTNVNISNVNITGTAGTVILFSVSGNYVENSHFNTLFMSFVGNLSVINNTFKDASRGVYLYYSYHNIFRNNTFNTLTKAIEYGFSSFYGAVGNSNNNTFYYNNFTNMVSYNIYHFNSSIFPYYNNTFNTSVNNYSQGNAYSDYCDKGTDSNNDGYADASTSGTVDWPYSENITTKIYDLTNGNIGVIDYGPKIQTCPAAEVFLGSSSSSSSSTTADSGSAAPAAESAPAVAPPAPAAEGSAVYSPAEAARFLSSESETEFDELGTKIKFILENTGTKRMLLFPQLLQSYDDPFFIITRKTLGSENTLFSQLSGLAYSSNTITGRLLKATLKNDEQIILEPGEKKETILELEEGLKIPRQIKIQFTTLGEVVTEKTVEQKAFSGTAVDLDTENSLMDLYVVIVPVSKQLEEYYSGNSNTPTGAAVADLKQNSDEYFLEFTINKDNSQFGDMYGPYNIKENQSLVFAQQVKYDPNDYSGINTIATKIYRGGEVIVADNINVDFGTGTSASKLSWLLFLLPLILIFGGLSGYLYSVHKQKINFVSPAWPKSSTNIKIPKPHPLLLVKPSHPLAAYGLLVIGILALLFALFIISELFPTLFQQVINYITRLGYWLIPIVASIILTILIIIALKLKNK